MTDDPVTNDQLVAGGQVAAAGIQAAQTEPTPEKAKPAARRAIRKRAEEVKLEISDDDVDRIADALVDKMDERGAFDQQPETVTAPAGAAPAAAGGGPPQGPPAAPVKTTWAERFRTR